MFIAMFLHWLLLICSVSPPLSVQAPLPFVFWARERLRRLLL
jgi:hypothetical protein